MFSVVCSIVTCQAGTSVQSGLSNSYSSGRVEGNHQVAPVTFCVTFCVTCPVLRPARHDSLGLEVTGVFTPVIFNMEQWRGRHHRSAQ